MGTLIVSDERFNMFDHIWTPVDGEFSLFQGSQKLGDAVYPDPDTALASGKVWRLFVCARLYSCDVSCAVSV